jgi:hypothetical protein
MKSATVIAVDLAKSVFQLNVAAAGDLFVFHKKLTRALF